MHCTWGGSKTNIIHRLKTFVVGYNNSLQFNNWTTDLGVCRWENSFIFAIVVGFWTPGHQGTRKVVWWVHLGKEQGWCGWVGGHCLHLGPTKRGWVAPLVATHLSWGMEIPAALLVLTSFLGKTIRYLFTRSEKVTVGFDLLIQLGSHPRTLRLSVAIDEIIAASNFAVFFLCCKMHLWSKKSLLSPRISEVGSNWWRGTTWQTSANRRQFFQCTSWSSVCFQSQVKLRGEGGALLPKTH